MKKLFDVLDKIYLFVYYLISLIWNIFEAGMVKFNNNGKFDGKLFLNINWYVEDKTKNEMILLFFYKRKLGARDGKIITHLGLFINAVMSYKSLFLTLNSSFYISFCQY